MDKTHSQPAPETRFAHNPQKSLETPLRFWAEAPGTDPGRVVPEDEGFFSRAHALYAYPYQAAHLDPKVQALVVVALSATVTQLDALEVQHAVHRAVEAGATRDEILCVLQLTSVIGLHSCSVGIPILAECARAAGLDGWSGAYTPEQQAVVRKFETEGPRPRPVDPMFDAIVRADPAYFERFAEFIDVPWLSDALAPEVKELVYIAIDVACTHLYVDGIRRHITAALSQGTTPAEIFEVIQLASATGMRTIARALPILDAILPESDSEPDQPDAEDAEGWSR
jgi:alkylhydroperoxidase/carboxymuconolactone decarboxylase family protein YurZ